MVQQINTLSKRQTSFDIPEGHEIVFGDDFEENLRKVQAAFSGLTGKMLTNLGLTDDCSNEFSQLHDDFQGEVNKRISENENRSSHSKNVQGTSKKLAGIYQN